MMEYLPEKVFGIVHLGGILRRVLRAKTSMTTSISIVTNQNVSAIQTSAIKGCR